MANLLEADPGEELSVRNKRTEEIEQATADENGVLRDSEGRSYSPGAYEIVADE